MIFITHHGLHYLVQTNLTHRVMLLPPTSVVEVIELVPCVSVSLCGFVKATLCTTSTVQDYVVYHGAHGGTYVREKIEVPTSHQSGYPKSTFWQKDYIGGCGRCVNAQLFWLLSRNQWFPSNSSGSRSSSSPSGSSSHVVRQVSLFKSRRKMAKPGLPS